MAPETELLYGRKVIINCIALTPHRSAQLAFRVRDDPQLELVFTEEPVEPGAASAYLIPSSEMEAILSVHKQYGYAPVIPYGPSRHISRAFALGCCDYLKEPWNFDELKTRIYYRLPDPMLMCPSTGEQIVLLPGALYGSKGEVDLTEEEHRIMRLLMTRPGVLVYREALQLAVWGRLISPGSRALDMHISILRKKIRSAGTIDPKLDPIPSVRRIGYRIAHDFVKDESIANRDNCEQAG